MRDVDRIHPFLQDFENVWKSYPDMRFGQLVEVIAGADNDIFSIEDNEYLKRMEMFLKSDAKTKGKDALRKVTKDGLMKDCFIALANKEGLHDDIVSDEYLDFAITIRSVLVDDDETLATVLITSPMCEALDIRRGEITTKAVRNLFKTEFEIKPIFEAISAGLKDFLEDEDDMPVYVASTKDGFYGASFLLREDLLKKFADENKSDVYILPSSVHEVILIPKCEELDVPYMKFMVKEVNGECLSDEDVLSNSVYIWDRSKGKLRICEG